MTGLRFPKVSNRCLDKRAEKRAQEAKYREAQKAVKRRDGGRCRNCSAFGTETHHIVARSLGRDDSPSNLVLLCHDCHQLVQTHYLRIVGTNADKALTFERNEFMR